jgi:hypothetical protein
MAVEPGPGLRSLQKTLGLDDSEINLLAERYPDKELTGPAEFVLMMVSASSNPALSSLLGGRADKADKLKIELLDLLINVKRILVSDGPLALSKYLDNHPYLKNLGL